MHNKIFGLLLLLPLLAYGNNTIGETDNEHVVFDKTPIAFIVPVGKQRMISFPDKVSVTNTDPNLTTDKVSMFNNNGTLYITAKKPFESILLPVKLVSSGQVVLIYLSSLANAKDNNPIDVVLPSDMASPTLTGEVKSESSTFTANSVSLIRFAAQQFSYKRLAILPNGVSRTPLYTTHSVSLYYGDAVSAFPLASWRAADLYVSAVQLKNATDQTLTLDPRYLRGNWKAAAFYRFDTVMSNLNTPKMPFNVLTPQGTERDYTVLFLVSEEPFGQAIKNLMPFSRPELKS